MKGLLILVSFANVVISCNNSGPGMPSDGKQKTSKSRSDSLMDEVMEGHNTGMAKISKLNRAKKNIQHALDSLVKLPGTLDKRSLHYRMQLDSAYEKLTVAGSLMDKWMEEFNMDSAQGNEARRIEYLGSEKIKIGKVKEAILTSLQKADSVLNLRH